MIVVGVKRWALLTSAIVAATVAPAAYFALRSPTPEAACGDSAKITCTIGGSSIACSPSQRLEVWPIKGTNCALFKCICTTCTTCTTCTSRKEIPYGNRNTTTTDDGATDGSRDTTDGPAAAPR